VLVKEKSYSEVMGSAVPIYQNPDSSGKSYRDFCGMLSKLRGGYGYDLEGNFVNI
jgi:hypothetical protein